MNRLTREEQANKEVGTTSIDRRTALGLILFFIVFISMIPVIQGGAEIKDYSAGSSETLLPSFLEIYAAPGAGIDAFVREDSGLFGSIMAANEALLTSIVNYENSLEQESLFREAVIPPVQNFFASLFSLGNEKAVIGKEGWLFYTHGIEYLTSSIEPVDSGPRRDSSKAYTVIQQRTTGPAAAIIDFHRQLRERNIELILVPAPVKPMFYPRYLSRLIPGESGYLQNPGYRQFMEQMEEQDIRIFDAAETVKKAAESHDGPLFLKTDTHWTPEAAEYTAERLAEYIESSFQLSAGNRVSLSKSEQEITAAGDIARMLTGSSDESFGNPFPENSPSPAIEPETVRITPVLQNGNEPWAPDKSAEILFLGDSFSNIYSHPAMGWGESAGFVELLSYYLERPLDRIIQNDNGAYATRQALQYDLSRGRDRLAGKKVVIWEFAVRELVTGNWKQLELNLEPPRDTGYYVPESGTSAVISGIVYEISSRPVPNTTPYKDHILSIHLVDVTVEGMPDTIFNALVYSYSMQDYRLTETAHLRIGQEVTLSVKNWYDVEDTYNSINRSEIDDDELLFADPCWSEEVIK